MDMLLFFVSSWSFILSVSSNDNCKTTSMCLVTDGGKHSSICNHPVSLSCDTMELIMLINIVVYVHNNKDDKTCNSCETKNTTELEGADEEYMKVQYQLFQTCSYRRNCTLSGAFPFKTSELGDKHVWYIVIDYCCVAQDIVEDGCAKWTKEVSDKPIHIVTPYHQTPFELSSTYDQCYCTIQGEAVLTLVEYTPCGNYVDCVKDYSLIYINGNELYHECWKNCENTVYFNERLPDTYPMTTTVNITRVHQKMIFWYLVERNSSADAPVVSCNSPSLTSTSITTVTASSKTPTTSKTVTEVPTTSSSNSANRTDTSNSIQVTSDAKLTGTTEADSERFPVGAIVGSLLGSIAVAVLLVIAVFIFRRSRSDKGLAEDNRQHNAVQFQQNSHGVANNAYVETNITHDDNNGNVVYATVDKSRKKNEGTTDATYADTYEDDYSTTTASHVPDQDTPMYNTFTESDEYSHTQTSTPAPTVPSLDNYSHITLPVNNTSTTSQDDTYNHITLNTGSNNPVGSEIYYNVEP